MNSLAPFSVDERCGSALSAGAQVISTRLKSVFGLSYRLGNSMHTSKNDTILARGDLDDYPLAHSARAELCRRIGRIAEARVSYQQALKLTQPGPRRRLLEQRLASLPE